MTTSHGNPKQSFILLLVLTIVLFAGTLVYSIVQDRIHGKRIETLTTSLQDLNQSLAATTADFRNSLSETHTTLSNELNQEREVVGTIRRQLGDYREEVGDVSETVSTLQKLSKTDPELLQKYSKVFFLNEHYAPPRLTEIPNKYKYSEGKSLKVHAEVWPHLEEMLEDALDDKVTIYVQSAFRSFNEQGALKGQYSVIYGAGTANQFSADQGYSEHQLGTAVDFIAPGLNGSLDGFDTTPAYTWLLKNAHKYGFVLSYPKGNAYYVFEPWHWRYVGIKLAKDLNRQGKGFYDMDQREIDEYLVDIFD